MTRRDERCQEKLTFVCVSALVVVFVLRLATIVVFSLFEFMLQVLAFLVPFNLALGNNFIIMGLQSRQLNLIRPTTQIVAETSTKSVLIIKS